MTAESRCTVVDGFRGKRARQPPPRGGTGIILRSVAPERVLSRKSTVQQKRTGSRGEEGGDWNWLVCDGKKCRRSQSAREGGLELAGGGAAVRAPVPAVH